MKDTYVYIGSTVAEAQSMAMANRGRDRGHQVIVMSASSSPGALYGRRGLVFEVSPRADLSPLLRAAVRAFEGAEAAR